MKYNTLNILSLAAAFVASVSCLDMTPEDSVSSEGIIVDIKSANVVLMGAYDAMQSCESTALVTLNYAGDNVVLYSGQAVIVPQFKAAGTSGWDPTAGGGYSSYYTAINELNAILAYLPPIDGDAASKNRILAEAHFLRGLAYFDLARTYGGVPVMLEPSESPDNGAGTGKSTYSDVLSQVGSDLREAVSLFDDSLPNKGRASKWAAYALLARLALYQEDYDAAVNYSNQVLSSGRFSLCPEVRGFFSESRSAESIFEFVFSSADKLPFYTYYLPSEKGGRLDYIPNPALANELLDPAKGGKRSQLIEDKGDGVYVITQYANQDGSSSLQTLRLAEQYLIRAEASLRKPQPDADAALRDLNALRERAALAPLGAMSVGDLLLQVETERRYELAFDGHRFNDIVRTGRAAEIFGGYDPAFANSNYWVLPFPNNAILADPDLVQNPGY